MYSVFWRHSCTCRYNRVCLIFPLHEYNFCEYRIIYGFVPGLPLVTKILIILTRNFIFGQYGPYVYTVVRCTYKWLKLFARCCQIRALKGLLEAPLHWHATIHNLHVSMFAYLAGLGILHRSLHLCWILLFYLVYICLTFIPVMSIYFIYWRRIAIKCTIHQQIIGHVVQRCREAPAICNGGVTFENQTIQNWLEF